MTIQARVEQGKVFLPANAPWLADFLAELLKFPNGKNDDQCLVAGTLVETPQGGVPIEQVSVGDMVVTPEGVKRVVNAGCTSEQATVYRVLLSNGAELVGTGNHPVMTTDGWMTIDELTYSTCVVVIGSDETTATVMLKEVLPEPQAVFNLTVEDAHVYYANGILTHNCDTFSYLGLMINDVSPPAKATPKPKASWRDKLKKLGTNKGDTWMSA
jgi:hypothetical protein